MKMAAKLDCLDKLYRYSCLEASSTDWISSAVVEILTTPCLETRLRDLPIFLQFSHSHRIPPIAKSGEGAHIRDSPQCTFPTILGQFCQDHRLLFLHSTMRRQRRCLRGRLFTLDSVQFWEASHQEFSPQRMNVYDPFTSFSCFN